MRQLKNFCSKNEKGKTDNETLNTVMGKYGGMKEDQLIDELMKRVREQKANGTYDPEQMESFVRTISPRLSKEQRQKLNNIIGVINRE